VALSAVVFGLSHIGFETLQLAGLVALGIVLGVLAVRTGRLGPSMFAHAGFNGLTMLAVFLRR
jgi:membrane protease YdiL (CAAX protease family)